MRINRPYNLLCPMIAALAILLIFSGLNQPAMAAEDDGDANIVPISGVPRPEPVAQDNDRIYNDYLVPDLPAQSRKADIDDNGQTQANHGSGVAQDPAGNGQGLNLYRPISSVVCNNFNQANLWASVAKGADVLRDSYAGWGAFAVDNDRFFKAQNVFISRERAVGPGNKYDHDQSAAKISSSQPYAAGFGSPLIAAAPGSQVTVRIKYMIFDHDTHGDDYDWVSLGIKPDATLSPASYVNGYTRGAWQTLSHTITAGSTGEIMVLIQAESPAALNSNIYLDDVEISIGGQPLADCTYP